MEAEPSLEDFLSGELNAANFRHVDHVRMGFELLQSHDFPEAVAIFARSLKHIAARAGASGKYHETITLAFLSLIAERCAQARYPDFATFAAANSDLMEKSALLRWYTPSRLASAIARETFVLPEISR